MDFVPLILILLWLGRQWTGDIQEIDIITTPACLCWNIAAIWRTDKPMNTAYTSWCHILWWTVIGWKWGIVFASNANVLKCTHYAQHFTFLIIMYLHFIQKYLYLNQMPLIFEIQYSSRHALSSICTVSHYMYY